MNSSLRFSIQISVVVLNFSLFFFIFIFRSIYRSCMNSVDTSLTRKTNRAKHGRPVINPGTLYSYDLHMSMHHKVVVNAEEWGGRGAVHSSNFRYFQIPDSQCTLPHTLKFFVLAL